MPCQYVQLEKQKIVVDSNARVDCNIHDSKKIVFYGLISRGRMSE